MKILNSPLLIVLAFLLISISTFSQDNYYPGKIINNNGDTISGYIEYLEWGRNPLKISFKKSENSEPTVYTPEDLLAFQFEDFIYRSRTVTISNMPRTAEQATFNNIADSTASKNFLLLLIQADLSLYQLIDKKLTDYYYIEADSKTANELIYFKYYVNQSNGSRLLNTNNKYKGQLIYYLQACPDINPQIQKTGYTKYELFELVKEYAICAGLKIEYEYNFKQTFTTKSKQKRLKIGAYAGGSYSKIKFKEEDGQYDYLWLRQTDFPGSINPAFGLLMNIEPAAAKGKWAIVLDILIKSYSTSATYFYQLTEDWYRQYDMQFAYTFLNFNPMFRYYFRSEKDLKPYLNAGGYLGSTIRNNNETNLTEYIRGNYSYESESYSSYFDSGISFGGGIKFNKFYFDLRYTLGGFSLYKSYDIKSSTQSLFFLVGYQIYK
jgi:hypothetical protein